MILYQSLFSKAGVILAQWLHSQALLLLIKTPQPVTFDWAQPTVWTQPTPEKRETVRYQQINWKLQTSKSKLTGRREHTNHSKGLSLPDRKGNRCACHTLPQASSPPDHTAQQEKSLIHTSHSDDPPFSLQAYGWVSLLTTHIKYALLHFLY